MWSVASRMRRAMLVTFSAALALGIMVSTAEAQAASRRASVVLAKLPSAPERTAGYDRDAFRHWVDADGDGCDARREVLIMESVVGVSIRPGCVIVGGQWFSAYDGVRTTDASTFDIDHVVALAEAWRSGADRWDAPTRSRFANDLGFPGSLIAVSASSNRSKGDRDPAAWLPPRAAYRCDYAVTWIQVKYRWRLSVDRAERQALRGLVRGCANPRIELPARARVDRP